MKRTVTLIGSIALILGLALSMTACDQVETDLIAGGGNPASETDVGDVVVWDDNGDYLYLAAVMANWIGPDAEDWEESGWSILDAHAHVAANATDIPQKNGNPRPGKFDLHFEDGEWEEDGEAIIAGGWEIMLTQAMKDAGTVYIALHLEVVNDQETEDPSDDVYESVWADGPDFIGKNWATYFEYELGSNPPLELP
jgi:hypothetical protein